MTKENDLFDLIKKYKISEKEKNSKNSIDLIVSELVYRFRLKPNIDERNPLSILEMICLILLSVGKNNRTCANLIGISPKSIKTYELRIRRKLSAKNRTNAFYLAQLNGYITLIV